MIIVNARFLTQKVTGVQRFAIEISKILNRILHDQVVFLTPGAILNKDMADELGATVYGKNTGTVWEQIDLRYYLITNGRPLLINFCNTGVLFYRRQIVTIHDMSYKVNPEWFSRRFYLWYKFLIPNIARTSLKILTVSNSSKNDLIKYLNLESEKITVIYNSSSLPSNNNFEKKSATRYFLTVSSMDARKNLDSLIEAFNKIEEDVKLIVVGSRHNNFAFNMDEASFNENIIIMGYVTDAELRQLMVNATAFICVSLYEGFGLPPIEAMSIGCPVLVSDIPAHREICADAALYVNPIDIDEIASKIVYLLEDNDVRMRLVEAGKKNMIRFNWTHSAQKIADIAHEIL